jgi:energy-coupling factor transporter ATPase
VNTIIRAEEVSYTYGLDEEQGEGQRKMVLDGIGLEIEKGSSLAILGVNGSGKSTLAKCMNALLIPAEGRVLVKGMDTAEEDHVWEIRSTVGMVFQNPDNQIVSTIVEEDVAFGPENLGVPPEEIRKRVDRALEAVGLYELRNRSSHDLSGGQKQREAIAGVLAMEPECVIFDESTAMLDPQGRKDVLTIIDGLRSRGITTILITHFMEEAARADRILILKKGKIIADGSPEAVFSREREIRSAGLELPHAVRIRNLLREKGLEIPDQVTDMESLADFLSAGSRGGPVDEN